MKRGEDTRQNLLIAGLELFGTHGFDGTSVRMLSLAAKCNLAAIPYHFGSKDGLYKAVAQDLAEKILYQMKEKLIHTREIVDDLTSTRETVLSALSDLLLSFGEAIMDKTPSVHRFMSREKLQPTQAFDVFYESFARHLHETLTVCVARLKNLDHSSPEAIIQTHIILGSFMGFISGRPIFLKRIGWNDISGKNRQKLRAEYHKFLHSAFQIV